MTLEQRIAEALRQVADLPSGTTKFPDDYARAVVAELGLTRETRMLLGDADEERFVTDWRPML